MTKPSADASRGDRHTLGILLVCGAALLWSTGGLIVRSLETTDTWTTVFWRSATASLFLLAFIVWRNGAGTFRLVRAMGLPGVIVGLCYTSASILLIISLSLTSVANALVIISSAPLLTALLGRAVLGERVSWLSWIAILASAAGIALMVSDSTRAARSGGISRPSASPSRKPSLSSPCAGTATCR